MTDENERTPVDEALAAWETKGPTSLTVALLADALYGVREQRGQVVADALRDAADAVEDECRTSSARCFCGSAAWLRERAAALSIPPAEETR